MRSRRQSRWSAGALLAALLVLAALLAPLVDAGTAAPVDPLGGGAVDPARYALPPVSPPGYPAPTFDPAPNAPGAGRHTTAERCSPTLDQLLAAGVYSHPLQGNPTTRAR